MGHNPEMDSSFDLQGEEELASEGNILAEKTGAVITQEILAPERCRSHGY